MSMLISTSSSTSLVQDQSLVTLLENSCFSVTVVTTESLVGAGGVYGPKLLAEAEAMPMPRARAAREVESRSLRISCYLFDGFSASGFIVKLRLDQPAFFRRGKTEEVGQDLEHR